MPDESEGQISAIFERLRDQVRGRPAERETREGVSSSYVPSAARLRAERAWSVSAERAFQNPPEQGVVRRTVANPSKRALRKLMRWYVEPLAGEQRSFNSAMLALVDELAESVQSDVSRLERRLQELETRLANDGTEPGK